jgi:hypothetical protein
VWLDIGLIALFIFAIYAFIEMTGWRTRMTTRRSIRNASDLYDQYGDSPRKQRRYAKEHGGQWTSEDSFRLGITAPPPHNKTAPPRA